MPDTAPSSPPVTDAERSTLLNKAAKMGTENTDAIAVDEAGSARPGQGLLKVPSRSSSQQKTQSTPSATGRSSSSGRSKDSKNSYTEPQGNGSLSGTRHAGDAELASTPGHTQPSSPSASEQKQRRKKGGLLSLLGCCGVPDDEDKNNVHKLDKLPQRPTTAKSRSQTSQDQYARPSNEKTNNTATVAAGDNQAAASGSQDVIMEETDAQQKPTPAVAVEPPSAPQSSGGGNSTHADDSDMPDAPAEDSTDTPAVESSEEQDASAAPSPPGPGIATAVPYPPADAVEEQRKWLLPPIAPEHKGRKCLVLDLDETLVHSSFKVCTRPLPFTCRS